MKGKISRKKGKYHEKEIKKYVGSGVKSGLVGNGKQDILFMVPNTRYTKTILVLLHMWHIILLR